MTCCLRNFSIPSSVVHTCYTRTTARFSLGEVLSEIFAFKIRGAKPLAVMLPLDSSTMGLIALPPNIIMVCLCCPVCLDSQLVKPSSMEPARNASTSCGPAGKSSHCTLIFCAAKRGSSVFRSCRPAVTHVTICHSATCDLRRSPKPLPAMGGGRIEVALGRCIVRGSSGNSRSAT